MAKPYLCPVCQGRGTVPVGFYCSGTLSSNVTPETCRTCGGLGMVWDYTDNGVPVWNCVGPIVPQDINKTVTRPPNGTVTEANLGGAAECNTQAKS